MKLRKNGKPSGIAVQMVMSSSFYYHANFHTVTKPSSTVPKLNDEAAIDACRVHLWKQPSVLKRIGFLLCCSCHQRGCTFPQNTLGGTNCSLSRSLSVCQVCIFDLGESSYFCTIESPSEIGSDWVEKPDR